MAVTQLGIQCDEEGLMNFKASIRVWMRRWKWLWMGAWLQVPDRLTNYCWETGISFFLYCYMRPSCSSSEEPTPSWLGILRHLNLKKKSMEVKFRFIHQHPVEPFLKCSVRPSGSPAHIYSPWRICAWNPAAHFWPPPPLGLPGISFGLSLVPLALALTQEAILANS